MQSPELMGIPAFVYVELFGALLGIVLLIVLSRVARGVKGTIGSAVRYLTFGVFLFTASLIAGVVMDAMLDVPMATSMFIHMSLMVIAMTVIISAALVLMKIVKH